MFHLLIFICLWLCRVPGVFADSAVVKSVMKGDSVTLESGVAELQPKDAVKWSFGPEKTNSIARINKEAKIFNTSDGDAVGFRDRLKLDHQTGSLTIMNTITTDSGVYQIIISGETTHTCTFNVTIYTHLPVPVITSKSSSSSSVQNCSVVCSVVNVNALSLSWYKGNSVWSSISVSDLNNSVSLDLKCLDDSYSCVVNISITNQTTHLTNTELCQPCPVVTGPSTTSTSQLASQSSSPRTLYSSTESPSTHLNVISSMAPLQTSHFIMISAGAVAVSLLTLAIVGIIWICRNPKKTDQKETVQKQTRDDHRDDEVTYAAPTFYKKNTQRSEDEVVYAGIVTRR